jgi:tetratricopeptide (TPR) repeat protein
MAAVASAANTGCADAALGDQLLGRLDGLPLAIAQAGAYLQESRVSVEAYLRFYDQQWDELMAVGNEDDAPLQDYPDRSVWTTWAISYQAIYDKHKFAAHLLLLWSFLDNKDLWHGLFATACGASSVAQSMLSEWIGDAATSELAFSRAMMLLCSYSLVEAVEGSAGYTTHPVVHRWAHHSQGKRLATKLGPLAVVAVGWAVPDNLLRDYAAAQRRLLRHVQAGSRWVDQAHIQREGYSSSDSVEGDAKEEEEHQAVLDGAHLLGNLYYNQGKLTEAEQMYLRALRGKVAALGPEHTSTLNTVNNLGNLYYNQGKLAEAEQMYLRALQGYKKALGDGPALNYLPALNTFENLGDLYEKHEKPAEARTMYSIALPGLQHVLGPSSDRCVQLASRMHALSAPQARIDSRQQSTKRQEPSRSSQNEKNRRS